MLNYSGKTLFGQTIGHAGQGNWMAHFVACVQNPLRCHALFNMMPRQLAVTGNIVRGLSLSRHGFTAHLRKHGLANFHRHLVELFFNTPCTRVSAATLDRINRGVGYGLQEIPRFQPHVLHAQMAGDVVTDMPQGLWKIGFQ